MKRIFLFLPASPPDELFPNGVDLNDVSEQYDACLRAVLAPWLNDDVVCREFVSACRCALARPDQAIRLSFSEDRGMIVDVGRDRAASYVSSPDEWRASCVLPGDNLTLLRQVLFVLHPRLLTAPVPALPAYVPRVEGAACFQRMCRFADALGGPVVTMVSHSPFVFRANDVGVPLTSSNQLPDQDSPRTPADNGSGSTVLAYGSAPLSPRAQNSLSELVTTWFDNSPTQPATPAPAPYEPPFPTGTLLRLKPTAPSDAVSEHFCGETRSAWLRGRWLFVEVVAHPDFWCTPKQGEVVCRLASMQCASSASVSVFALPAEYVEQVPPDVLDHYRRLCDDPPTPAETRQLRRVRPVLSQMLSFWYHHDETGLRRKYLQLLRGVIAHERLYATQRFIDRFRHVRRNLAAATPGSEPVPFMEKVDRALKNDAPGFWPKGLDHRGEMIGIELEFVTPKRGYKRPEMFGVHVGYDGSVIPHSPDFSDPRREEGNSDSEARVCIPFGRWQRLENACGALQAAGCVANTSCGLHVHLDMRNRNLAEVKRIARRLASALPFLNCLVPANRWRDGRNRYCKPGYSFRDRYHAINGCAYREFQTLEVRLFAGSLNAAKIRRWVEVLRFLVDRPAKSRAIRTIEDFLACKEAPSELKRWAYARWHKLYPLSVQPEPVEVSEQ